MNFSWVTIHVRDMERSLDFYRDIVGLSLQKRYNPTEAVEIAFLGEGETKVELICGSPMGPVEPGRGLSIGFAAESLEACIATLESRGIPVAEGPYEPLPGMRFLFVLDPDGVRVQIIEEKST